MLVKFLRAKIHRATVTEANVDYVGSITIDRTLLDATGILPGEGVLVANVDNGNRFETYVFEGKKDSGVICINGAAAHLAGVGEKVIIMAFGYGDIEEASRYKPKVVIPTDNNGIGDTLGL